MSDYPLTADERNTVMARQIAVAQLEIAEKQEYVDNLKRKLYEYNGEVTDLTVGDSEHGFFKVTSYMGKSFNGDFLKKNNPEAFEKAAETKKVVTAARAKALLSEEEYAQGQKSNTNPTVKVEVLNNDE